jgi:hypothetical protein
LLYDQEIAALEKMHPKTAAVQQVLESLMRYKRTCRQAARASAMMIENDWHSGRRRVIAAQLSRQEYFDWKRLHDRVRALDTRYGMPSQETRWLGYRLVPVH